MTDTSIKLIDDDNDYKFNESSNYKKAIITIQDKNFTPPEEIKDLHETIEFIHFYFYGDKYGNGQLFFNSTCKFPTELLNNMDIPGISLVASSLQSANMKLVYKPSHLMDSILFMIKGFIMSEINSLNNAKIIKDNFLVKDIEVMLLFKDEYVSINVDIGE